ncbi:2284_t:CDS:1, partial [Funneliformis geosporum]
LKTKDISEYLYKIHDDSVRPRHFLSVNNADEIEAILSNCKDHSLHEIIDGNELL